MLCIYLRSLMNGGFRFSDCYPLLVHNSFRGLPRWLMCGQSCLTLCDLMDCSPPGFSVHGISQARILEWVVIPFFRGSSWSRDRTWVSCIVGRFFSVWATREANCQRHLEFSEYCEEAAADRLVITFPVTVMWSIFLGIQVGVKGWTSLRCSELPKTQQVY